MIKIDVCVNVFGKPYQTLVTLKSLLKHSGDKIDRIYLIKEKEQPNGFDYKIISNGLNYDRLVEYTPKYHFFIGKSDVKRIVFDKNYRMSLRYQYGLERTDKKHLLIIHNDVLFEKDIVSEMLNQIGDCFTIGQIGQCWNCPMFYEKKCSGEILSNNYENQMSYDEVIKIVDKHPTTRTFIMAKSKIDTNKPFPLPECRVNEWCALVNTEYYKMEVIPNGSVVPFGGYYGIDLADEWFNMMVRKGYKFKNFDLKPYCTHAYFSNNGNGHSSLYDGNKYQLEENNAKEYLKNL
jgi:hypothetical protein